MARSKTHKDVEFMVETTRFDAEYFKTTDEAVAYALANNVEYIDVLCGSRAGAVWFGCEDDYDADPEASVTCRYRIDNTGEVVDVLGHIA